MAENPRTNNTESSFIAVSKTSKDPYIQQTFGYYLVVPTFKTSVIAFGVMTFVFLLFGIISYQHAKNATDFYVEYSDKCLPGTSPCTFEFTLDRDIKAPVHMYYKLENFFSSHRQFVKSRLYFQLLGTVYDLSHSKSKCGVGYYLNSDLGVTTSILGTPLLPGEAANPCGKMAKSFFTDTYILSSVNPTTSVQTPIAVTESGFIDAYIKKFQFHNSKKKETQHIDYSNEHFMAWSQMETLNSFLKPWGIINQDMPKGKYTIVTDNSYNVLQFNGKKGVYFTSTNSFGGTNRLVGILFFISFAVSLLTLGAILILHFIFKLDTKRLIESSADDLTW